MPDIYPPSPHILSDLRLEIDRASESGLVVRMPVVPELTDEEGVLRSGVLGTATDVFGGSLAIEAAQPDWAVTAQLELHVLRRVRKGPLALRGQALRSGRTNVVIEVEVEDGEPGIAAVASMIFTKIRRRDGNPQLAEGRPAEIRFEKDDSGFCAPLLEAIGLRDAADADAALELDLVPYVRNSVNALQGGVVTMLVDAAAQKRARETLGAALVTTDLSVHYLSLGKVGPLRASARLLRADAERALLRVELRDRGAENRLLSIATARVGLLGEAPESHALRAAPRTRPPA